MLTYPITHKPNFSYNDFLMHEQYIGDLKNGMQRVNNDTIKSQALSTKILHDTINKNGDFIANTIDSNFTSLSRDITGGMDGIRDNISQLDSTLDSGFRGIDSSLANISSDIYTFNENVSQGLDQVSTGISVLNENMAIGFGQVSSDIKGFHSDFNIAMGGVILQFEMQREEMKQGFNSIINILENKRKTDAAEDFRDAMDFYNDGCKFEDKPIWFKNAHKHFTASIEKYERNPLAHLHMAHIYHYQEEFRDFDKALEHYELCYTYGEADEKSNAVTAQGYFYAGWLKASVFNDIDSAIEFTKEAIKYDNNLAEAHYNIAKFYASIKDGENAIPYLKKAIVKYDRNYSIKAMIDSDFLHIKEETDRLLLNLKEDSHARALEAWKMLKSEINSFEIATADMVKLSPYINKVTASAKEESTYFNNLNTLQMVDDCRRILDDFRLLERDELKNRVRETWHALKDKMDSLEIAISDMVKLSPYINNINIFLEEKSTYFDTLDMLQMLNEGRRVFDDLYLQERDKNRQQIYNSIKSVGVIDEDIRKYFEQLKNEVETILNPGTFEESVDLKHKLSSNYSKHTYLPIDTPRETFNSVFSVAIDGDGKILYYYCQMEI